MAFFTANYTEENVKDFTGDGSKYINKSGMYEVIIKSVIVEESAGGSQALTLWIEHQGQEQPLFQVMRLTNKGGAVNTIGQDAFTKFMGVCGVGQGESISDPISRQVPVGKGGENKECMVLADFDDIPMHIRVQVEYGMYEGDIQLRKHVRNFFRFTDKATCSEIINGTEAGKQYEAELEFADKVTYSDGLTVEDIQEWLKNRKSNVKKEEKKPSGGFGGRKFGLK